MDLMSIEFKDFIEELRVFMSEIQPKLAKAKIEGRVRVKNPVFAISIKTSEPIPNDIRKLADDSGLKVIKNNEIEIIVKGNNKDFQNVMAIIKEKFENWGQAINRYKVDLTEKDKQKKVSKVDTKKRQVF